MTRRDAFGSLAVFAEVFAASGLALAEAPKGTSRQAAARSPVFKGDLPTITMKDWEVTVSYVDYTPGRVGAPHKHAGFVLAYVLEGAVIVKISGQGEERTFTAGEMFYEAPGAIHEVSKNASQTAPAKLLAMVFAKKGAT